jgi:hypothetical protein
LTAEFKITRKRNRKAAGRSKDRKAGGLREQEVRRAEIV